MTSTILTSEAQGAAAGRGRLDDRRVLVVGGGTRPSKDGESSVGNGRAIAVLAAREGAHVAVADVSLDSAQATVDLIYAEGREAFAVECDVRDETSCNTAVAASADRLGGLDGVVLNVGIAVGGGVVDTTTAEWDDAFAVNARGHFQITRAALPLLARGSSLVYISSTAGQIPSFVASYDASKGAVEALARQVASLHAPDGVRANVVSPHAVDTPLGRFYAEQAGLEDLTDLGLPMGRSGTPWEVAYAALFLLSNESSYTSGQVLFVDGAFMLNGAHR